MIIHRREVKPDKRQDQSIRMNIIVFENQSIILLLFINYV